MRLLFLILVLATAAVAQLTISSDTLPPGVPGGGTHQFTATGGTAPYTWTVAGAGSISATGLYTAPVSTAASNHERGCQLFPNSSVINTNIASLPIAGGTGSSYSCTSPNVTYSTGSTTLVQGNQFNSCSDMWMNLIRAHSNANPGQPAWHNGMAFSNVSAGINVLPANNPVQQFFPYHIGVNLPNGGFAPVPINPDAIQDQNTGWNSIIYTTLDNNVYSITPSPNTSATVPAGLPANFTQATGVPCLLTEQYTPEPLYDNPPISITQGNPTTMLVHLNGPIAYHSPPFHFDVFIPTTFTGWTALSAVWGASSESNIPPTNPPATFTYNPLSTCGPSYTTGFCVTVSIALDSTSFPPVTPALVAATILGPRVSTTSTTAYNVHSFTGHSPYSPMSTGSISGSGIPIAPVSMRPQDVFNAVQQGKPDLGHALRFTYSNAWIAYNAYAGATSTTGANPLPSTTPGVLWPARTQTQSGYVFTGAYTPGTVTTLTTNQNLSLDISTSFACNSTAASACVCVDPTSPSGFTATPGCTFPIQVQPAGMSTTLNPCWYNALFNNSTHGLFTATLVTTGVPSTFTFPANTSACTAPPQAVVAHTLGIPYGSLLRLRPYNTADPSWSSDTQVCAAASTLLDPTLFSGVNAWNTSTPACKYLLLMLHTLQNYGTYMFDGIAASGNWLGDNLYDEFLTYDEWMAFNAWTIFWNHRASAAGNHVCGPPPSNGGCAFDNYVDIIDVSSIKNSNPYPQASWIDATATPNETVVTVHDSSATPLTASMQVLPIGTAVGVYPEKLVMAYGTTYQLQPWVTGNTNTSVTYSVPPTIDGITPNAWPTGASVSATGLITAPPAVTVETSQPASIPPTTYLAIQSAVDPTAEVWMQVEFIPKSGDGKIRLAAGYVSGPRYGPDASGFYWWGTNPAPAALSYLAAQGGSCQINYKSYIPNRLAMGPFAHYCGGTWNSIHAGTGASAGWGTGTSQPTDYLLNTTSINALGSPQTGSGGDIHFKLVVPPGDYAVTLYGEPGGAAPTSASSNAVIAPNDVVFDYELQGSSSMAVTCTPIPCASASRSNNPPQGLDTYLLANSGWNLWQMTANTTVGSNGILDIAARGRRILGFTPRMASVLIAPVAATSFTISGAITGAPNSSQGILVTLTGPAGTGSTTQTTFTGTGGSYTFSVLVPGSYTIAPTLAGWTFTPASIPVTVSTANLTGQNFTALPVPAGLSIGHIGPHP